jgi:hypothetical protein
VREQPSWIAFAQPLEHVFERAPPQPQPPLEGLPHTLAEGVQTRSRSAQPRARLLQPAGQSVESKPHARQPHLERTLHGAFARGELDG